MDLYSTNNSRKKNDTFPSFTLQVLQNCTTVLDLLKKSNITLKNSKNHYEIMNLDEVAFFMLDDNYTNVQLELDNIRARKHKFICLNDDMKFRNEKSIKAVHDFYESILPLPSSFELEYKKKE